MVTVYMWVWLYDWALKYGDCVHVDVVIQLDLKICQNQQLGCGMTRDEIRHHHHLLDDYLILLIVAITFVYVFQHIME